MSAALDQSFLRRAALLLAALALLLDWPMLLGRVPFPADVVFQFPPYAAARGPGFVAPVHAEMGDLATEMYPWRTHIRRSSVQETFPLWNPHSLLGAPFVGDPQPALFYPPTLLYAALPTPLAWSIRILLGTVLAGLLAAILARELGAGDAGALASGLIFAISGWVTAFQTRPHLDSVTWLALVLLAVDRLRKRPGGRTIALTAAAFAVPVLAGQPEIAAHVTFVGLAFFLFRLSGPGGERGRFVGAFAAAGVLAFGLAAVQALPTIEFVGQLDRSLSAPWAPKPLSQIAAFLSRDLGANPNSAGVPIPEGAAYAGMLTLLLAPLALLHRNRRDAVFFTCLLAGVLSIVYGQGPVYWVSLHTPILRGMPNGRLLAVADLSLAVLAGLGLSALAGELRERHRARRAFGILAGLALAGAAAGVAAIRAAGAAGHRPHALLSYRTLRGPASSAAALLAAGVFIGLALAGRIPARRLAGLAMAFLAIDLLTASYRFIPFCRPDEIFPPVPTFDFLKRAPGTHRVASVDGAYGPGFDVMYGLDSASGFNVVPRRTERMLATFGTAQDVPVFRSDRVVRPGRLLDLMNVKYVVATTWNRSAAALASRPDRFRLVFSDASVRVYENLTVLPRAFLVPASGVEVLPTETEQFSRVTSAGFDPEHSVVLSDAPYVPFRGESDPVLPAAVTELAEGVNDVRMTAGVAVPSVLVLSQTHYPGWRVEVDGAPAPLLRADYGFDGVALAPGRHRVRFALVPNSLRIGALMTAAALAVCAVLVLRGKAGR